MGIIPVLRQRCSAGNDFYFRGWGVHFNFFAPNFLAFCKCPRWLLVGIWKQLGCSLLVARCSLVACWPLIRLHCQSISKHKLCVYGYTRARMCINITKK